MTTIFNFDNATAAQSWLSSKFPALPQDALHAIASSFVYSFTVTVVLSKGNLIAGLTAGALSACAAIIQIVCLVLVKKGNDHFGSGTWGLFDRGLCFMVALVTIESLGLGMKARTSLLFSLLPLLLARQNGDPNKTPLLGVIL